MLPFITAGLDGSAESRAAAEWAAAEALRRGLPLRLLLASGRHPGAHAYGPHPADPALHRHWAERIPREAAAALRGSHQGLTVVAEQVAGPPAQTLLEAAADSELLVLGSRAVRPVTGYLMGSVSLAVTSRADRPVVLVRAGGGPAGRTVPEIPDGDVVVGLDLSRPAERVLEFAFDAAARRTARLRVLHSRNRPSLYGEEVAAGLDVDLDGELAAQEADEYARVVRPWQEKFPAVTVTGEAVVGTPARHLVEAAATARLVVVGRRAPSLKIGPRLGPVAHAVLHHSTAPVAVVPHD
ncbi:universal stress protein [Streptomyces sp. HPF1205]|uniref:universal stress protein n=1 Tax=Streptomyces sp. HPF1205 TaxID=2873262 RepID=UPI001CEC9C4D|nr:universal stress protein [Streptomyces sp. HPF1205]